MLIPLFLVFIMFFISCSTETNRAPLNLNKIANNNNAKIS